jgi:hypothetical protein
LALLSRKKNAEAQNYDFEKEKGQVFRDKKRYFSFRIDYAGLKQKRMDACHNQRPAKRTFTKTEITMAFVS